MNLLDRLEERFERLIEGGVAALLRSPLQPAEIGRKLERAMVAGQVVSVGARLVPNDYRVGLHPDDLLRFADYLSALSRHLERWLTEVARERGFTLVDAVRVRIEPDERVARRGLSVAAAIAERSRAERAADETRRQTTLARLIREATGVTPLRLRYPGPDAAERETILRARAVSIGRARDNDVVLDGGDVSRHHARFEFDDGGWRIVDTGSTNGTRVNGRRVEAAPVAPGDEIRLGTTPLRLLPLGEASAAKPDRS